MHIYTFYSGKCQFSRYGIIRVSQGTGRKSSPRGLALNGVKGFAPENFVNHFAHFGRCALPYSNTDKLNIGILCLQIGVCEIGRVPVV